MCVFTDYIMLQIILNSTFASEMALKGLIGVTIVFTFLIALRFIRKILIFSTPYEKSEESIKNKFLFDKFKHLIGQNDEETDSEIINIVVCPPKKLEGDWIVKKIIKSNVYMYESDIVDIEIYRKNDKSIDLELGNYTQNVQCKKCGEENEISFEICWNCQEKLVIVE